MKIELPIELMSAKEYITKVTKLEDLTYDTKLVRLEFIEPKTMEFLPGQYAQIKVPGIEVVRAYSIASDPKENSNIEFVIRYVPKGQATTYIHKALIVGDTVTITGPYGDFYLNEKSDKDIICIAGGSGKAPILSILSRLEELGMKRNIKYFFGAKAKKDLYLTEYLQSIEKKYPNFQYIPALSEPDEEDEWKGETGLITEVVERLTSTLEDSEAYLCGSPGMIDACIKVLEKKQMPSEQIHYDKFS